MGENCIEPLIVFLIPLNNGGGVAMVASPLFVNKTIGRNDNLKSLLGNILKNVLRKRLYSNK